ncbi:hypothetical protein DES54_15026 [Brenneria salicis ATCC 15712 = DSM 30166]|uniref:Malate/lactate dehydrogenase-like protein n=1 Tax=Brenneria salicis ATCC 15712 = DSM 30166 TaxID=714314 RepID=A0A366I089_9GAMM|nr:hypothetical protein DES54_15026 [Brenneria salicis ATCC 15712 = DSM 30166]
MTWLQQEYDAMFDYDRTSHAPAPEQPILIAGESEIRSKARREAEGIELSYQEWQKIVEAGVSLGMSPQAFV